MAKPDFHEIESKIQKFWEDNKIYSTNLKSKEIYSVDTPPPNISGKMHIGHAFGYSQQDFIVRFMRMKMGSIFYPFGTDDNGLPTERLIEKTKKIKSIKMSRADFVKLCLEFLKDYTPEAIKDWKDLGISCDYNLTYSTIDPQAQKVSQKSFLDLYKKGHVYKENFPTIWCPHCQTSIAQAELEDKEFSTKFSTLKFECEGKDLLIATTRPEMLPACVAVFVNPKDERYKDLVGKKVKVPLLDFEVPILEDESAQIDKGTGVLMICSYGDRFDLDSINRHKLEAKTIIEKDGTINFGDYSGLKVKDARKKILENLESAGKIKKTKEMVHAVNVHDKCGTPIEFVNTPQWFIRIMDKKQELIDQGNKIKWYPEFMHKRYDNWVKGLEWDWSISRNRHFGVPIPAWECEKCNELIFPEEKDLPVDPLQKEMKCKCGEIAVPEKMVLDTWATSSVTPQIASDLVKGKIKLPFSLRPQGHDIIRTWAFYTIVKSYLVEEEIPWKDIVISGNVSLGGEKMSKSKGNVVGPEEVIKKYCADALRYWAAGSKLGMDLDYQEKDLVTGKKLINKILNATNFVFMNLENYDGKACPKKLEEVDQIFLTKVGMLVERVTEYFMNYEYSKAKQEIDGFFWSDFCDNYLEIVKKRVYQGEGDKKLSAQYALYKGLSIMLKLFAPIVPFVTEEVYQKHFKKIEKGKSIHLCSWPVPEFNSKKELNEVYKFDRFVRVLEEIRKEKSNAQKSMNSEIKLVLQKEDFELFNGMLEDLGNVTGAVEIIEGQDFKVEFVSN
ncbi:valine--tRNA ligase [archaeon]|jgi:valyl-tRNA synthetase|nr:valine--tRNA ligase [archaeon]